MKYNEMSSHDYFLTRLKNLSVSNEPASTKGLNEVLLWIDLDKFVYIMLEEYVSSKRKLEVEFTEEFIKKVKGDKGKYFVIIGLISFEDLLEISSFLLERKSNSEYLIFPGKVATLKAYLYSLTSQENNYIVHLDKLLEAMIKFGLICPSPYYIHALSHTQATDRSIIRDPPRSQLDYRPQSGRETKLLNRGVGSKNVFKNTSGFLGPANFEKRNSIVKRKKSINASEVVPNKPNRETNEVLMHKTPPPASLEGYFKLDTTSALFAQHFTLIRDLKKYMNDFKELIENESEIKEVWRCFENLARLLEDGCNYLSFPVQM